MAIPAARAQGADQGFVVAGELRPADLVGEIEVAIDLVSDLDGHTQEGGHRGMIGGKTETFRVISDLVDSHGMWFVDEQAQDASVRSVALRSSPHLLDSGQR